MIEQSLRCPSWRYMHFLALEQASNNIQNAGSIACLYDAAVKAKSLTILTIQVESKIQMCISIAARRYTISSTYCGTLVWRLSWELSKSLKNFDFEASFDIQEMLKTEWMYLTFYANQSCDPSPFSLLVWFSQEYVADNATQCFHLDSMIFTAEAPEEYLLHRWIAICNDVELWSGKTLKMHLAYMATTYRAIVMLLHVSKIVDCNLWWKVLTTQIQNTLLSSITLKKSCCLW